MEFANPGMMRLYPDKAAYAEKLLHGGKTGAIHNFKIMKLESLKSGKFFKAQLSPEMQRAVTGGGTYSPTNYTASNGTGGSDKVGYFCSGDNYDYGTKYDDGTVSINKRSTSPLPGTKAIDY